MNAISLPDDPTPLSTILEHLRNSYPDYYRAWKSMITSYGSDAVCEAWRGTLGLAAFIQDTTSLPDSPTLLPAVRQRLKRKVSSFQFDKENVYWKVPAAATRRAPRNSSSNQLLPALPASTVSQYELPSIASLKEQYPTTESIEARMEMLFTIGMSAGLSASEETELDILGKLAVSEDGSVPVPPASKFEDI